MRFIHVGKDGNAYRIRGDDESVSAMSYQQSGGSGFTECFGVGEGYLRLKNTATASLPASPDEGAMVYDSTLKAPVFYNGTDYKTVLAASYPYEEGEFTPTLQQVGGDDDDGQTYSKQEGLYTRIGNLVHFSLTVAMTDLGTLSGSTVRIAHLPYTANGDVDAYPVVAHCANLSITANQSVVGLINANGTVVDLYLWDATTGPTNLSTAEVTDTSVIRLTGHYPV